VARRTAYRVIEQLRGAGLDVLESPRREHAKGFAAAEYRIAADSVRIRMGLRVK
jgi:hypothetical protein